MKNETHETDTNTLKKPFILRAWLKNEAKEIRELKDKTKKTQREGNGRFDIFQSRLYYKGQNYRHHHIACCELFGRTREAIEKPNINNLPNEHAIESAKVRYAWTPEEIKAYEEKNEKALCANQR